MRARLVKIGNSDGRLKGLGMAIAGMVLPVVMLPIAPSQTTSPLLRFGE